MLFKDLKVGDTLYLFDKNAITLSIEKVVSVSAPHVDTNCAVGMVVGVKVSNRSFTMRDTADICYTDTLVISPDRTTMLREVEAQKANDEALIAREKALKEELPKLDAVIDQLAPERKERKEHEERIIRVEEKLGTLTEMIELMLKNKKDGSK